MKVRLFLVQTTVFTFGEKTTKSTTPHLICSRSERKISLIIWGCICYDGVETLTAVEGNINSAMYIDILDINLWPVVVWYFEGKEYWFMDDNAPVHRAHTVDNYRDQNLNGMASKITRFKSNRKYLALHEKRATKVCGKYRYQKWSSAWNPACVAKHRSNWII